MFLEKPQRLENSSKKLVLNAVKHVATYRLAAVDSSEEVSKRLITKLALPKTGFKRGLAQSEIFSQVVFKVLNDVGKLA